MILSTIRRRAPRHLLLMFFALRLRAMPHITLSLDEAICLLPRLSMLPPRHAAAYAPLLRCAIFVSPPLRHA